MCVLSTHYWVYHALFDSGLPPTFYWFTCLLSLFGFHAPIIYCLGLCTAIFRWIYAPYTFHVVLCTLISPFGSTTPYYPGSPPSFRWDYRPLLSGSRTRYPLCGFKYVSFIYITHLISIWVYVLATSLFGLTHLLPYVNWFTHLTSLFKNFMYPRFPSFRFITPYLFRSTTRLSFGFTCPLPFIWVYTPVTFLFIPKHPLPSIWFTFPLFLILFYLVYYGLLLSLVRGYTPHISLMLMRPPNFPLVFTHPHSLFGLPPAFYSGSPPSIPPLLMEYTLGGQECHLLVEIINRVLYKSDDPVRPRVHKILVVIEPLLISEDYYARVQSVKPPWFFQAVELPHIPY
jgi:hypothetical protein